MAKGLCKICAKKWFKGHKCSPSVQLHVVQEIWDMLGPPNCESPADCTDTSSQLFVTLSQAAVSSTEYSKTLKFWGYVAGCQILILVDSGSSHSFINAAVASKLPGVSLLTSPLNVAVANGDKLSYTTEIQNIQWPVDSYNLSLLSRSFHFIVMILYLAWIGSSPAVRCMCIGSKNGCHSFKGLIKSFYKECYLDCHLLLLFRFCVLPLNVLQ